MNMSLKKLSAITATLMLSLVGFGAISTPAHAGEAECQFAKPEAANDNPVATLRLISPVLTDDNSVHRTDFEGHFVIDCNWFGVGMRFNQVYVPLGMSTTLTYHASKPNGTPLINTKIQLRANKSYSNSNAKIYVNGHRVFQAKAAPNGDGWNEWATTDLNGNVSFVVKSPATCTEYYGMLPPAPTSLDAMTPNDKNMDPTTDCFAQLLPSLAKFGDGEATETADFVELHYFDPAGLDNSATTGNADVAAPVLDENNAILTNDLIQTYVPIGSKQTIVVQATREDGSYIRDHAVTLKVNLAGTGANAKVSVGPLGVTGTATLSPVDLTKSSQDQLVVTGRTDAFGNFAFVVLNSDTSGETAPTSSTSPVPSVGGKFVNFHVELDGVETNTKNIEVHYYKPAPIPVTSITATATGRIIKITINNAIGKTSTISITGKPKVTLRPTVAKKVLTYTVTKGTKKVVITANGKTLTKTFIIK
jgi:hypothetical protein